MGFNRWEDAITYAYARANAVEIKQNVWFNRSRNLWIVSSA
jgi:hypothetical protein